ncbi:MAG: DUF402 domain-containing protein [Lachnospiraceae bacterium]|nr:DUF402 domain-containing protein [Lachnospiraceae bacterium]
MKQPILYRKRIIPEECILLKDDLILRCDDDLIVTKWTTLKPKKDLHHGFSCYYLKEGYKVSKFYREDNSLLYYYCDIIRPAYDAAANTLMVTDLLADVIIYPDGFVKVVDLDEMVPALESGALSQDMLKQALISCNHLLTQIYSGKIKELIAPIDALE